MGDSSVGRVTGSPPALVLQRGETRRPGSDPGTGLNGSSAAVRRMTARIDRLAETDVTVLIRGASGTGKERVARALHRLGKRRGRAFVAVNCAALPETLLESELFGIERGVATGVE